jgi:SAM-dependent methyltransferase
VPASRDLRRLSWRALNGARKLRAGLPLRSENVSPEVSNDLFQAHLSIYGFFALTAPGLRVLDLGCGTGYGAECLRRAGGRDVVGIDRDPWAIRYARRRWACPNLRFVIGDVLHPPDLGTFDVIVSSNVFEHLESPDAALEVVTGHLAPDGKFLMVVPPIVDDRSLRDNQRNRFHRSNLRVDQWLALLATHFDYVRTYRHVFAGDGDLDFSSPFPSAFAPEDFTFVAASAEELVRLGTLGAVYACE